MTSKMKQETKALRGYLRKVQRLQMAAFGKRPMFVNTFVDDEETYFWFSVTIFTGDHEINETFSFYPFENPKEWQAVFENVEKYLNGNG